MSWITVYKTQVSRQWRPAPDSFRSLLETGDAEGMCGTYCRRLKMAKPLMAKATAVWLVDNTTLTFKQIADFSGMHELEVQGLADESGGVKGFDPIASNQLTQ